MDLNVATPDSPAAFPAWAVSAPAKPQRLWLAVLLFAVTFFTCLAAGRQFAISFANGQAASVDEFVVSLKLLYKDPTALAAGFPFAISLMAILLAHELGHYFACRHHGIRASYPYFIPAPTLIGTLGAFILMRSPIRSRRALFGASPAGAKNFPRSGSSHGLASSRWTRRVGWTFCHGAEPSARGAAGWWTHSSLPQPATASLAGLAGPCGACRAWIFSVRNLVLVDVGRNFAGLALPANSRGV